MIANFYDPTTGVAPVTANMNMKAFVSTPVYVRLLWMELHPGEKFNKYDELHVEGINGLKWIYNIMGRDWRQDPLFKTTPA